MRSKTWGALCSVFAQLIAACSDQSSTLRQSDMDSPLGTAGRPASTDSLLELSSLQARHQYRYRSAPFGGRVARAAQAKSFSASRSALPSGSAVHFENSASGIVPRFLRASTTELALPESANGPFRIRDKQSGIELGARLLSASPRQGVRSNGYLIFPGAGREGQTLIQRPTELGIEDYIEFTAAPDRAEISYEIELQSEVAGLRLVSNTLEFVDATGSPGLRIAPPYLVTADGDRVQVALEVEGCAVDRDPGAPWGRNPVSPGASSCRVRLNWEGKPVKYPALLDPAWNSTGALANARSGASAVVLPDGLVVVAGGFAADQWSCLDSAELYNPATRSFAATGNLTTPRCRHAGVRRANGQLLLTGGIDAKGEPLSSTEIYDAAQGTWTAGAPMKVARADHEAVLLNTGDVLVGGGSTLSSEKLSNTSSSWNSAGSLIAPVAGHTITVLADGRALLLGGSQPQVYVPASNNWYPAPLPLADYLEGHAAVRLKTGQVLLIGAQSPSTALFDPNGNTWSNAAAALVPRYGHTATSLPDGRVLIAGGLDASESADLSSELYDPKWGTFSPASSLTTPRSEHTAVLLPTGRVLLLGGIDEYYNTLASAEEFDPGALGSVITEYKLPARVDEEVLGDRVTELWGSVTRPSTLATSKRYPLILFLHGNHGTCGIGTNPRLDYSCEYTESGTCPPGYVVTPNHRGYDYVATALAARGYVVVSINANRGINCAGGVDQDWGLNLARGRLILRHLEQLSAWNRGTAATPASIGVSLANRLDLQQVGLVGHSRGGEGVRAAYQQYRDAGSPWPARIVDPVVFRALYEIGPVDGQSARVLNAEGARWNVLLPMCDGDVSDLEGVRPFDRMVTTYSPANASVQSTYTVWGANHNFYNTEWQDSDSYGCLDHRALFSAGASGSAEQRQTAMRSITEFFLANVGTALVPALADLFNPQKNVMFDSRIERGYGAGQTPSMTLPLEDFTQRSGFSSFNLQNDQSRVSVTHGSIQEHDSVLRAATVRWTTPGSSTYLQTNFTAVGSGLSLSGYDLLDFRIGRANDRLNFEPNTNLAVQFVNADNSLSSSVSVANYTDGIVGPVGGPYGNYHQMLSTIRIPLSDFTNLNSKAIRGVRFTFNDTPSGVVYLTNIRATRSTLLGGSSRPVASKSFATTLPASTPSTAVTSGTRAANQAKTIVSGNQVTSLRALEPSGKIEVTVTSTTPFLPRSSLLVIDVGAQQGVFVQHPAGNLQRAVFLIDRAAFDATPAATRLLVHYQRNVGDVWDFGMLDKSQLK